jgi:enterochelin esterase-like enzyme
VRLVLALTGTPLLLSTCLLAVVTPFAATWWWSRIRRRGGGAGLATTASLLVAILVAQALAISGVFLAVNRSYTFYTSWGDLVGTTKIDKGVTVRRAAAPDHSRTEVISLRTSSGTDSRALVWLPKQYDEPQYAHQRFPVVVFLPGQPSTPNALYSKFDVGQTASRLIDSGKVAPFVVVMPPLMTNPPRDTECTNVPGGPQAETFLSSDVPQAVQSHLRVLPRGPAWTLAGWSTGAFCAAKLGLTDPQHWGSLIAFGGYYSPLTDRTTGNLFHGRIRLEDRNSPLWLYAHRGTGPTRLLMVAGKQDRESWPETTRMIQASQGDPNVSYLAFPVGGHNFRNYNSFLGTSLEWAKLPAPS